MNGKPLKTTERRTEYIFFAVSILFLIFSMSHNLMHSALWGDEWAEYHISQKAIRNGELYQNIVNTFQPPLYNYVMHFWLRINQSLVWFRSFNVVIGTLAGAALYLTIRKLSNYKIASLGVVALASCYQWIFCVQECSEYALMLFLLFIGVWAYVMCIESFSIKWLALLIVANVGAIYSQYGSVFVAAPLLISAFIRFVLCKDNDKKRRITVLVAYIASALMFALPLYVFFLKIQLANNQISENKVAFSPELMKDLPFTLGRIITYFYHLDSSPRVMWIGGLFTLAVIAASIFLIVKGKLSYSKKSILVMLCITYLVHYLLVQLHIYAMVHPDKSAGFLGRYSYFYIPLLLVAMGVIFDSLLQRSNRLKTVSLTLCGALMLCMFFSYYDIWGNWYKAKDDQFAKIWVENRGYECTTYLFGVAEDGFDYYISHEDGFEEYWLDSKTYDLDMENLPDRFWAWRTNWGGNGWIDLINKAREEGYTVTVYDDSGYDGQLAYCERI